MWYLVVVMLCFFYSVQSAQDSNRIFALTSPAFSNNRNIPSKYTCDGKNVSPALRWTNAPRGTKSFALIVDDPGAPERTFTHWVVFNIPRTMTKLPEGLRGGSFISGVNDFYYAKYGVWLYGGPCPPSGSHRYYFTLYALDTLLSLSQDATKEDLMVAMKSHILGEAQLIGLYQRKK